MFFPKKKKERLSPMRATIQSSDLIQILPNRCPYAMKILFRIQSKDSATIQFKNFCKTKLKKKIDFYSFLFEQILAKHYFFRGKNNPNIKKIDHREDGNLSQ